MVTADDKLTRKAKIKQTINDQAIQTLENKCGNSSKGQVYKSIKSNWEIEHYLSFLGSKNTKTLIKFRTGNHKLPVETGRYRNIKLIERKCPYPCCVNLVGYEYHYTLECPKFKNMRNNHNAELQRNPPSA